MFATKNQIKKIREAHHGYGILIFKSSEQEVTEIEIYIGKDNKLRRVNNGKLLFPIRFTDEDGMLVNVTSGDEEV